MFEDIELARRIEAVEAALTRAVTGAVIASGRAPRAFLRELAAGVASYLRPSSPLNKLIGMGLVAPIDEAPLARIEALMRAVGEPTRIELSTLAHPEVGASLLVRGYRLLGFENVLVRSLGTLGDRAVSEIRVERVTVETVGVWSRTSIDAAAASDNTGEPVDQLSRSTLARAFEDFLEAPGFQRYLAFLDGRVAGAASIYLQDGIALLGGSATLPAARRRGVQSALIGTRLADAQRLGAELAVVTTAPDSQSQANLEKFGFSLAYARAILVLE